MRNDGIRNGPDGRQKVYVFAARPSRRRFRISNVSRRVWTPDKLNSYDRGPFDTTAVGSYPSGASPYGLMDAAGQVFEWTSTPAADRFLVKGGSWDDMGCGVCRPAARHARPAGLKHILIGFRLVRESRKMGAAPAKTAPTTLK